MNHTRLNLADIPAPGKNLKFDDCGKRALKQGRIRLLVAGSVFALAFTVIAARDRRFRI